MRARSLGTFRALDHTFALEVDGEAPVDIADVFSDLRSDGVTTAATYTFRFDQRGEDQGELERDGRIISAGRARVLLQVLITRLGHAISEVTSHALHATTLEVGRGTVLIAGGTARGKSTLSARLLLDGARLIAEDISALEPETLHVRPYHRPLGLAERSFELLGIDIPPAAGEPCGCGGKVLVKAEHLGASVAGAARPTVIALVDRDDHVLRQHSPARALSKILEAGVAPTPGGEVDFDVLIRLLAQARFVTIGSAGLDEAAEWMTQMAQSPTPEPVATFVEHRGERIDVYAGTEALLVEGDRSHLLNEAAAAVWFLHNEGRTHEEIGSALGADVGFVRDALAEIADSGVSF